MAKAQLKAKPEGTRRKRRTPEEITERLLRAAFEVFTESGYSGATTAVIAARAEVTEAQLFRYFNSKAELFRAAIFQPLNQHFCDFQSRHIAPPPEDLDAAKGVLRGQSVEYITELQDFIGDHARMLLSLVVAQAYGSGTDGGERIDGLAAYFDRGAAMMARRPPETLRVEPELMVRVSFAAVLGCVLFKDWIFPPGIASDEAIRRAVNEFVLDGINANGGPAMMLG
jgi:AcrR family transcriptional regulator